MKTKLIASVLLLCMTKVFSQGLPENVPDTTMNDTIMQTQGVDSLPSRTDEEILPDTIPQSDGYYQVNDLTDAIPFAYPKVNPKNIRFYKRVWRDIDLADKENYIFATPGSSLIEVIMKGIQEGKLTPYNPEDDGFKTRLTAREGEARFTDSVMVPIFDDEGNQIDAKMALNEFNPEKVTKFRIKEDMFFDKQRGRLETRIIGVAPLMTVSTTSEVAESVGETPAFWLYFPQLRYSLVKVDVSDPDKELYDMTMDDLFVQRKFASKIIRESSPGQQQSQYADNTSEQEGVQEKEIEDKIESYKKRLWRNPKGVNSEELMIPGNEYKVKKKTSDSSKEEQNQSEQAEEEKNSQEK